MFIIGRRQIGTMAACASAIVAEFSIPTGQRSFRAACTHRRIATEKNAIRIASIRTFVICCQHSASDDGVVAAPACKLVERPAVLRARDWNMDRDQQFAGLEAV